MDLLAAPAHFVVTFGVAVISCGVAWAAIRRPEFVSMDKLSQRFFGAGWVLIAVAELVHGSAYSELETSVTPLGLRSGGFAAVCIGLLAARRDHAPPQTTVAAVAPGASLPALLGFMSAVLAHRHGGTRAFGLSGGVALLAASDLVAFLAGSEVRGGGAIWVVIHVLRLAAGVSLGLWLWIPLRSSMQARFVAVFATLLLVVVVAISALLTTVFANGLEDDARERSVLEAETQSRILNQRIDQAVSGARQVANFDSIRRAVPVKDPRLQATAEALQQPGGPFDSYDFLAFVASSGELLALSAQDGTGEKLLSDAESLSLSGTGVVQSALEQVQAGSIDALGTSKIILVGAFPVLSAPGIDQPGVAVSVAGAVVLGAVMDESYVETLQRQDAQEAALIIRDAVLASTHKDSKGVIPTSSIELNDAFDGEPKLSRQSRIGDSEYFSVYIPLRRTDGAVVGAVVVSQRSEVLRLTQEGISRTLFLVALAAIALGIFLSLLTSAQITRPIRRLTGAAERVREGDLQTTVAEEGADEVGTLSRVFGQMTHSLSELTSDLREQRNRLAIVLESMADGVFAVDATGKVVSINPEASRILNTESGKAIGQSPSSIVQLKDSDGRAIKLDLVSIGRASQMGTIRDIPVALTSAPILGEEGAAAGAVVLLRDLTPEREVEKMKTDFLANISHELRTPLTPIMGYAELLKRKGLPRAKTVSFVSEITHSASRLERIVDMLVDFSAMQSGRLPLNKERLDLDAITKSLIDDFKVRAPKHKFVRTGFRSIANIDADPRLLPRAISELLDNAVKFSPKGGAIKLSATKSSKGGAGRRVELSVADQGVGMDEETTKGIGESFVQGDASATRRFGGLGLGLAFVTRIADGHGGELQVESRKGRGSKFTLVLPTG